MSFKLQNTDGTVSEGKLKWADVDKKAVFWQDAFDESKTQEERNAIWEQYCDSKDKDLLETPIELQ